MKNIFSMLFLIGFSLLSIAQKGCISGNTTITLGQTSTFTTAFTAQCSSCYDWDINGNTTSTDNSIVGTLQIVSSDMLNPVNIKGVALGPFTIQLTYFDETGCHNCSISGNVVAPPCDFVVGIAPNPTTSTGVTPPTVTFTATTTPSLSSGVTYNWTVTYQDGSTATYTGTTNTATFPSSFTNPIVGASIYATYLTCNSSTTSNYAGVYGVVPLPTNNCFGFDPAPGTPDYTSEGLLNYGYIGSPYGTPISSVGLTFTWYFKFQNPLTPLLILDGQNPTFREKCPDNPVKSFALSVSNGVTTKQYKDIVAGYPISGFSGANSPTCFIHPDCSMGMRGSTQNNQIIVSPNPTKSLISFNGKTLEQYSIVIYDESGNVIVKDQKIDKSISIENQKNGIYFYTISNKAGYKQEGKIIKE